MSDFEGKLKAEAERYLALLEELGAKLKRTLPIDCNDAGTPSRDWSRGFGHYSGGTRGMLAEQRERMKLQIMAGKAGQAPMTDEELDAGLRQLQLDTVRDLPEQELRQELKRRGVVLTLVPDSEDPD